MIDIENIKNNNIIIDGISGSGKSDFVFKLNNYFPKYKYLVLTNYNKIYNNIDIFDFVSFSKKYYNNINIKKALKLDPIEKFNYDVIIIDNVQNLELLNYNFFKKIYDDNSIKSYIYVFGDKHFINNNSNIDYLLLADNFFDFNNFSWIKYNINISNTINIKNANFINHCLLLNNTIKTKIESNNKPKYYICDINIKSLSIINDYLNNGYNYNDILIISPSLKTNAIKLLIKNLSRLKISYSISEEDYIDKLLILSYIQTYNIKRKIVIIFNFDYSYTKYYKNINNLYIGSTRSLNELILLHHHKYDYLPFFNLNNIKNYCDLIKSCNITIEAKKIKKVNLNNLSEDIINKCMEYIEIKNIRQPNDYYIIHDFNNNVKNHIISKLNISDNVLYQINKDIVIDKYKFTEIFDCIDNNNIYKLIYSQSINNIDYISLVIQKYINQFNPINDKFEIYEKVYYNNNEYIINEINNSTLKLINLETSNYEILPSNQIHKYKEINFYLYNILTDELNIIESNYNKINDMMNYLVDNIII
jgi:hypothetical protein